MNPWKFIFMMISPAFIMMASSSSESHTSTHPCNQRKFITKHYKVYPEKFIISKILFHPKKALVTNQDLTPWVTVLKRSTKIAPPKKKKPIKDIKKRLTYRKPKSIKKTLPLIDSRKNKPSVTPTEKVIKKVYKAPHWEEIIKETVDHVPIGFPSPDLHPDIFKNDRPRLTIKKTNNHIYASLVDDPRSSTISFSSTSSSEMQSVLSKVRRYKGLEDRNHGNTVKAAWELGKHIGTKILEKGISKVKFDRSGYKYHGKVKAIAEGARAVGLDF